MSSRAVAVSLWMDTARETRIRNTFYYRAYTRHSGSILVLDGCIGKRVNDVHTLADAT